MPRIKNVLKRIRRRYAQAKAATMGAANNNAPPGHGRRKPKRAAIGGVEITRAVFPNKS